MIAISMLMMVQGLMCLLLAMPKYAKQVTGFEARDKQQNKILSTTGWLLLAGSMVVLLAQLGVGNGLVWLCVSLTFMGTMIVVAFSYSPNLTTKWALLMPVSLVLTSKGRACLPIYAFSFLLALLLIN